MEFQFYKEVVTLAETKNFVEAAERLYISQSTLSQRIKSLELHLGHPIFNRSTRKVELTDFGRVYYEYALQFLELEEECSFALSTIAKKEQNTVIIGAVPLVSKLGLQTIIEDLRKIYPWLNLEVIIEDSPSVLLRLLESKTCDICLLRETVFDPAEGLSHTLFRKDPMEILVSRSHPLALKKSVHVEELKDETFIFKKGTFNYRLCYDACIAAGFVPNTTFVNQTTTISDMVEMKCGITLFPKIRIDSIASKELTSVPLDPPIFTDFHIVYKDSLKKSEAFSIVLKALENS